MLKSIDSDNYPELFLRVRMCFFVIHVLILFLLHISRKKSVINLVMFSYLAYFASYSKADFKSLSLLKICDKLTGFYLDNGNSEKITLLIKYLKRRNFRKKKFSRKIFSRIKVPKIAN